MALQDQQGMVNKDDGRHDKSSRIKDGTCDVVCLVMLYQLYLPSFDYLHQQTARYYEAAAKIF